MPTDLLSAEECEYAKPKPAADGGALKPYKLFDGGGLFLFVKPNGAKLWRMKYDFGGREKLLSFGSFDLVSLAEARAKRDNARKQLLDGIDPATAKEEVKAAAAVTFEVVGEEWLKKQGYAAATLAKARWLFDQWLFPDIGHRPIADVKPADPSLAANLEPCSTPGLPTSSAG